MNPCAKLLGVAGVRLYHDQSLYKEPGGGITPAHADQYYWPLASDRIVTAWIPLQPVPEDMGPLAFYAGSHHHAAHARGDQGVAAGGGAAVVGAGFQGDIRGGASDVAALRVSIPQCHHLRMGLARGLGVAFPQNGAVPRGDDATHARIGLGQAHRGFRESLRPGHEAGVLRGEYEGSEVRHGAGTSCGIVRMWGFSPQR